MGINRKSLVSRLIKTFFVSLGLVLGGFSMAYAATTFTTTTITTDDVTIDGDTIMGDASNDTVTINSDSLAVPNDLNIDSNTLFG